MKNRLRAITVMILVLLSVPLSAGAQQTGKVHRIGYLSAATAELDKSRLAAFRQGLRELGYVEGENLVIEQRRATGTLERIPELAEDLVRLKVDVLVVYGGVHGVNKVVGTVPIVFTVHADPVGTGLIASLARPGGNVTGLTDAHSDLVPKRLGLLKEVAPTASHVAVLWNPANPIAPPQLKSIQATAPALGLTVLPVEVKGPEPKDIDHAFARIGKERARSLVVIGDPLTAAHLGRIAEFAVKSRLPAISTGRQWAEAGLLMSYGANHDELWRRAATYVDKILRGAKPADLPVEQPTKFDLVINLKTARALGLTVPPSLLLRADLVID